MREERALLGLKQDEFGQLGGVNRNTQGSYEKGERNPDTAYLSRVGAAGVDVLYVLTGERSTSRLQDLSPAEAQLLEQYRTLQDSDQEIVHRVLCAMAMAQSSSSNK